MLSTDDKSMLILESLSRGLRCFVVGLTERFGEDATAKLVRLEVFNRRNAERHLSFVEPDEVCSDPVAADRQRFTFGLDSADACPNDTVRLLDRSSRCWVSNGS